jgi:RNA recognition motif-containing protein
MPFNTKFEAKKKPQANYTDIKGKKFKNQSKKCANFNYLNIYVTGLPAYTIKEDFKTYLEQFGAIKSVKIPYKKTTG